MWEVLEITRTKSKFQLFSFLAKQHLKLLYVTEFGFLLKCMQIVKNPQNTQVYIVKKFSSKSKSPGVTTLVKLQCVFQISF